MPHVDKLGTTAVPHASRRLYQRLRWGQLAADGQRRAVHARHRHPILGLKLLVPCSFIHVHTLRDEVLHLHGPPKECKHWRRESLKGLLPYIRAVCAVGAAAHDGYSRPGPLSSDRTQGTGATPECPQPGLTFNPSLRFSQALLQNDSVQLFDGTAFSCAYIRQLPAQRDST